MRAHRIKKKRHTPPRCRCDLALNRQRRPRRVRRLSYLLPPPHRCRRQYVARPISSCENAPWWSIIGAGRAAPSMLAAFAPPAAATAAGAAASASAVDAAQPHPLPTPLPPPLPSSLSPMWAAGRGGDLASPRAFDFLTPTRRAAQRGCAAHAAQSSHARARANVGSSLGQRHEAYTSWPAHNEAEEEGRRCRTERRVHIRGGSYGTLLLLKLHVKNKRPKLGMLAPTQNVGENMIALPAQLPRSPWRSNGGPRAGWGAVPR